MKHVLRLTNDEKMHCRPTHGPRCVDLLVITADEFVVVFDPEDRLQLFRLLSSEGRLGADPEEGIEEKGEFQCRVFLLLRFRRLFKGFRRPQGREGGGVVQRRRRRLLRLLSAEAAVEAELQERI